MLARERESLIWELFNCFHARPDQHDYAAVAPSRFHDGPPLAAPWLSLRPACATHRRSVLSAGCSDAKVTTGPLPGIGNTPHLYSAQAGGAAPLPPQGAGSSSEPPPSPKTSPSASGRSVFRRSRDDHGPARPAHPPLRDRRDRQRKLALQESVPIRNRPPHRRCSCRTPAPCRCCPRYQRTPSHTI